jgi:hypothetical protein
MLTRIILVDVTAGALSASCSKFRIPVTFIQL